MGSSCSLVKPSRDKRGSVLDTLENPHFLGLSLGWIHSMLVTLVFNFQPRGWRLPLGAGREEGTTGRDLRPPMTLLWGEPTGARSVDRDPPWPCGGT